MDDTLVKTKSGRVFGTSSDDWVFWSENVVPKCKELVSKGSAFTPDRAVDDSPRFNRYKLVIFTNQGGINGAHGYDKTKERTITTKIENILGAVCIVVVVVSVTDCLA
jgi:histidinol phosphatase-like enzyme